MTFPLYGGIVALSVVTLTLKLRQDHLDAPFTKSACADAPSAEFLVLDDELRVRQVGPTLARLLPALVPGCQASAHLRIRRPPLALTYTAICANPRSVYVLEAIGSPLRLKGQMLPQPASRHLLFLCSPAVTDIAALERFILEQLTPIPGIEKIRSSFTLKQVRYKTALPTPARSG